MLNILRDSSEAALVTAIKTNLFDWYRYLGRSPNAELYDDPELTWLLTRVPTPFLNAVFCTQLASDAGGKIIAETLALFKAKRVTQLFWYAEPGGREMDAGKQLVAEGLTFDEGSPGMAIDLSALQEESPRVPGLTIASVSDKETLRKWAHTAWVGYGLPQQGESIFFELLNSLGFELPLRSYLGFLDGEPVGTAQLFLSAGVAGIYCVATVPEARRRGIGTAITVAPLVDARRMGYRIGILQSSSKGYPLYCRLGFREYCKMSGYSWNGARAIQ